ncbi:MAG: hypothetical protein HRT89_16170 [Lentisphaeria bacterium]|nr:hypothetical protein [Lentisphaeria bacterium]NQZ69595.1 hypothetical protein [Lentisphaeria bacterium]
MGKLKERLEAAIPQLGSDSFKRRRQAGKEAGTTLTAIQTLYLQTLYKGSERKQPESKQDALNMVTAVNKNKAVLKSLDTDLAAIELVLKTAVKSADPEVAQRSKILVENYQLPLGISTVSFDEKLWATLPYEKSASTQNFKLSIFSFNDKYIVLDIGYSRFLIPSTESPGSRLVQDVNSLQYSSNSRSSGNFSFRISTRNGLTNLTLNKEFIFIIGEEIQIAGVSIKRHVSSLTILESKDKAKRTVYSSKELRVLNPVQINQIFRGCGVE